MSLQPPGTPIDLDNWMLFDLDARCDRDARSRARAIRTSSRELVAAFDADARANYVYPLDNRGVRRSLTVPPFLEAAVRRRARSIRARARPHIDKKAVCADCHESADKGPIAGIPSVKTCMICHSQIATDRPLIKQVTSYSEKGIEIPWQRVYGFTREAHVRFNHAPHIRASVECSTCHGDVGKQTVAERSVDHNMGFCVNCHTQKKASNECLTCHY